MRTLERCWDWKRELRNTAAADVIGGSDAKELVEGSGCC